MYTNAFVFTFVTERMSINFQSIGYCNAKVGLEQTEITAC